jgi:DNA-directed RNA polymerase specialized sigma24 family protein
VGACNLKTWAASIATHVGFNALRSRRRERGVVDRGASIEASFRCTEGERLAAARLELEHVRQQLSAMKPEHAETVFLHDVLGHLLAEIAVMMGVSVAAATSRLVRGRRELYRRLEAEPIPSH